MTLQRRPGPRATAHVARISRVERAVYFLRSRGAQVVVLALVANTMVAQLLYNSAGQLVLGSQLLLGYLLFSAVCSTVADAEGGADRADAAAGGAAGRGGGGTGLARDRRADRADGGCDQWGRECARCGAAQC